MEITTTEPEKPGRNHGLIFSTEIAEDACAILEIGDDQVYITLSTPLEINTDGYGRKEFSDILLGLSEGDTWDTANAEAMLEICLQDVGVADECLLRATLYCGKGSAVTVLRLIDVVSRLA